MIKDISFNGLTQSPSDHNCTDGDLATCLNLIPEDGTLKPIGQGVLTGESLNDGEELKYVHKVTDEETVSHYIIHSVNNEWMYKVKGDSSYVKIDGIPDDFQVNSVSSIGNILCFIGERKTLYAYWYKGVYTIYDLGKINLSLKVMQNNETDRFVTDMIKFDQEQDWLDYFEYEKITEEPIYMNITAVKSNKTADLLNLLRSKCEKVSEESGRNLMPFVTFLVGAVKLYDGTYIAYSPIYVLDSTQTFTWDDDSVRMVRTAIKFKHWRTIGYNNASKPYPDNSVGIDISTGMSEYRIKVTLPSDCPMDLIEGIDIFTTRYDDLLNTKIQWGTKTNVEHAGSATSFSYFISGDITCEYLYGKELYQYVEALPFYKSVSIDKDSFGKEYAVQKVTGAEMSLTLADTRNTDIGGASAVSYNNRLHIIRPTESINIKNIAAPGIHFDNEHDSVGQETIIRLYNKKNEVISFVTDDDSWEYVFYGFNFPYKGYKHADIYTHTNTIIDGDKYHKKYLPLYDSETIGYSLYLFMDPYSGFGDIDLYDTEITKEEYEAAKLQALSGNNILSSNPSLIKVSEAENPLVFPAKNSVLVGSSVVNALATNTQPITEGQFGDAPLYAFTDEGTWMLMLNQEGTYSARQPVNRDICSNPSGILQIDNAVLFPTERGIVLQQGKTSELITEPLDGNAFKFLQIYKENIQQKVIDVNKTPASDITYIPFKEFMKGADMVYDYYAGRIIVYNPDQTYAYVYSLKSKMWGMMHSDLKKRVNIYPEAYAINKDNNIVDLYQSQLTEDTPYFLCTRPFGLDDAEAFKTIYAQITRGYFRNQKGKCGMVLYGSNDLFRWYLIHSSVDKYLRGMCGSPYKYFRLALVGSLAPDESLSGFSTEYKIRWNNKLR